jgi:hypothetical protein
MAVLLDTQFTGANGAAWPNWTHSFVRGTTGGAVDIQSNRGRLRSHDGSYTRVRADATGASITNGTIILVFRFDATSERYFYLHARTSGGSGGWYTGSQEWERDGVQLYIDTSDTFQTTFGLAVMENKSYIDGDWINFSPVANVDYTVKIELNGSLHRAKIWQTGLTEPSAWSVQFTNSRYTSGGITLSLLSGGTASGRQVDIDYITATDAVTVAGTEPSSWTSYVEATTPAAGSTNPQASAWTAYIEATTPAAAVRRSRLSGAWLDANQLVRRSSSWQ